MKTNQTPRFDRLEQIFAQAKKPVPKITMECTLPSEAILFLYDRTSALKIDMLVEKRSKEDYAIIQIEQGNMREYVFRLLLDALRTRYTPSQGAIILRDRHDRKIAELVGKLKSL